MTAPTFGVIDPTGAPAAPFEAYAASPADLAQGAVEKQAAMAAASPPAPEEPPSPQRVAMLGPDGSMYELPANKVAAAKAQGFRLESADERRFRELNGEHPWLSPLTAWYSSVLKEATLGVVDHDQVGWLVDHVAPLMGSKVTKEQVSGYLKRSQEDHPGLAFAGDVGGMLLSLPIAAPLAAGGAKAAVGVGRLVAGEAGAKIGGSWLGRTAAEGAALAFPKALREFVEGDPGRAAETVAWGAGGNLLFSAAIAGAGKALGAMPKGMTWDRRADDFSFRSVGDTRTRRAMLEDGKHLDPIMANVERELGAFNRSLPASLREGLSPLDNAVEREYRWKKIFPLLLEGGEESALRAKLEALGPEVGGYKLKPADIDALIAFRKERMGVTPMEAIAAVDRAADQLQSKPLPGVNTENASYYSPEVDAVIDPEELKGGLWNAWSKGFKAGTKKLTPGERGDWSALGPEWEEKFGQKPGSWEVQKGSKLSGAAANESLAPDLPARKVKVGDAELTVREERVGHGGEAANETIARNFGGFDVNPVISELSKIHKELYNNPYGREAAAQLERTVANMREIFDSAIERDGKFTFAEAKKWLTMLDDQIDWKNETKFINNIRQRMRGELDKIFESQMDRTAKLAAKYLPEEWGGASGLLDQYNKGQAFYQRYKILEKGVTQESKQQSSLRYNQISDNVFGGAVTASSGGMGSPTALASGALATAFHRYVRMKGNIALEKLSTKMPVVEASLRGFGARMAEFPKAIEGTMANAIPAHRIVPAEVFRHFSAGKDVTAEVSGGSSDEAPRGSKKDGLGIEEYVRLAGELTRLTSDPAKMHERIKDITDQLMQESPAVATAVAMHYGAMIQHLAQVMPKLDAQGNPYAPIKPSVSKSQLQTFAERLLVADDPHWVQHFLATRTLKSEHLETLFKVWPSTYRAFIERMQDHAMSGKAKPIDYTAQVQLSLLTGVALNPHMKPQSIQGYQKMYVQESLGGAPGMQGVAKPGASMRGLNGPGKSTLTTAQRLETR